MSIVVLVYGNDKICVEGIFNEYVRNMIVCNSLLKWVKGRCFYYGICCIVF